MRDAQVRRVVGVLERVVLGTAMAAALLVAEQLLVRMQRKKG